MNNEVQSVTVSWCPSHMGIRENEHIDNIASKAKRLEDTVSTSTILSKTRDILDDEYDKWQSTTRKLNALGHNHNFLPLKANNKRISPHGKRRKLFYEAAEDNIVLMSKLTLTRIITNCKFDGSFHDRRHIFCSCQRYADPFTNLRDLTKHKNGLKLVADFLKKNQMAVTFGDAPEGVG
ncbi:hypothetical protein AX15_005637 [Amanita polypyramis BW_CC]|nr:hypothetical protein AX15_005637 [Amanita polypyramis BW_CC]